MDEQHTPGPWHPSEMTMTKKAWASLNGEHPLTIVQANWDGFTGDVIAAVWSDDDHDELANARLIAAAPEMLEALQAVKRDLLQMDHPASDQVCAAIAKATGRTS